jgi:hypothetical protein
MQSLSKPKTARSSIKAGEASARARRGFLITTTALKDNFARLSATIPPESISKVVVTLPNKETVTIPNADGKRASLVFYAHLATLNGGVVGGAEAAVGLRLFDEVVTDAKGHRGSHPNIDLLLDVQSGATGALKVEVVK